MENSQWVNVRDNVPKDRRVLGFDVFYGVIGEAFWNGERLVFCGEQKDDCCILFWMPLPEPPEKENDGQ